MNQRTIYFTLVPAWLSIALERRGLSLEIATDLQKLENTLSLDDVCFYINYLRKAEHYIGDLFNDMSDITKHPDNVRWISKNDQRLASLLTQTINFYSPEVSLLGAQVPVTVRKTNYVAQSLPSRECLAIVGRDTSDPLNSAQLADQSVSELAKLMTCDEYSRLNVFRAFTKTAA